MPQPTEAHRKLQALVGTWIGDDMIYPSPFFPQGATATTKYTGQLDLGGFFVIGDDTQEQDGKVIYRAHKVFGWDDSKQHYTFYLVDSTGQNPTVPAQGTWEDNTLILQQETPRGYIRYSYTFEGDTRYIFRMNMSQDGKEWQPFIEGNYKRV